LLKHTPTRLGVVEVPISPIRARIAERMVLSKTKIPHAGTGVDVDMSQVDAWRRTRKEAPGYLFFSLFAVVQALKKKPDEVHVILTGRNAHPDIIEIADLVTEMKEIKHPFKQGILAQKGIEF
jgi:pyruvate/2-oxoglutarate dehydrogenase complex dihydrolipoamide acyltransferase (E2) component